MPVPPNKSYEKIPIIGEFIHGYIAEVIYDPEHQFKSSFGDSVGPAIQFKFIVEGCKFPKKSKFLKFTYSKKSNLFKKYIVPLVQGAKEYMQYDAARLTGLKVKMIWKWDDPDQKFQSIELLKPADGKLLPFIEGEMTPAEKQALIDALPTAPLTPLEEAPF